MSSFEPRAAGSIITRPDPTKHVNYNLGMVLGVDDFTQEFAYVVGRDQWMARDLLGYGTACGLRVTIETGSSATPQVVVTPGAAVSPRGQLIRVNPTQCADLNDWLKLERNRPRLDAIAGSLSSTSLTLYVVLCYRECRTDQVPIPGEPCRSEEESMAASRVADDFSLELRFDAPDQREEDALRDFVAWLGQIEITDTPGVFANQEQIEEAIRNAAHLLTSPLASPLDYMFGSPPTSLRIRTGDVCDFLRAAFRIWVTELRPIWLGQGETASGNLPNEECVLLAELDVPILRAGTEWVVGDYAGLQVNEERRPFLLHLRMIQEWLECGLRERSPSDTVTPAVNFAQLPAPGSSQAYSRADHTHGTPNMTGDVTVTGGNHTLVGALRGKSLDQNVANPSQRNVLLFEANVWKAAPAPPIPLGGDVTGTSSFSTLTSIQGNQIIIQSFGVDALQDGQVLTFVGGGGAPPGPIDSSGEAGFDSPVSDEAGFDSPVSEDSETRPPDRASLDQTAEKSEEAKNIIVERSGGSWQPLYLKIQGVPVSHDKIPKPANNQVLTYVQEDATRDGIWKAMNLPASGGTTIGGTGGTTSGPTSLAGDVTGAPDHNTVVKLRGKDISTDAPQDQQVLTFAGGKWMPQSPPAPTMGGDVNGTSGDLTVTRIQNIPIAPIKPRALDILVFQDDNWQPGVVTRIQGVNVAAVNADDYKDGAVLTFSWGEGWVPKLPSTTSQKSVQHPDGGPYSIVAAGIVKGDESVRGGGGYNGLKAKVSKNQSGRLTISFNGYMNPELAPLESPFFYIVKALPVISPDNENQTMTIVFFEKYQQESIVLRVTEQGVLVPPDTLMEMEFMLEISRYDM